VTSGSVTSSSATYEIIKLANIRLSEDERMRKYLIHFHFEKEEGQR